MALSRRGVVVDTCVLVNVLRGKERPRAILRELSLRGFVPAVSPVTVAELHAGLRKGEEQATEDLLAGFTWLPLTRSIAQKAGEIVAAQRGLGRTRSLDDMLIAAAAIQHGYRLLTENRKDFDVPEVRLYPD